MHTPSRELLLQVLSDEEIGEGTVVGALSSAGSHSWLGSRIAEHLKQQMPAASAEVIDNCLTVNAEHRPIADIYGPIETLDLRSPEELGAMISEWEEEGGDISRQALARPQAILQISYPGFSSDGTQGMLCIGYQQGGLAGRGICYLYVKTESGWRKKDEMTAWIS
jgi:hypothetical protein